MRYLLDELMAYEEGFSDMLMADRESNRHENFMAERASDESTSPQAMDLQEFQMSLLQRIQDLMVSSMCSSCRAHTSPSPSRGKNARIVLFPRD